MISERDIAAKCDYAFGEGEAKGLAEGEARGEAKKSREIARNLLADGLPICRVASCTGLSEEEVAGLR